MFLGLLKPNGLTDLRLIRLQALIGIGLKDCIDYIFNLTNRIIQEIR